MQSRPAATCARTPQLIQALDFQPCSAPFNVTAIPPASAEAPMEVYFLSPQVRNDDVYPFGGHFRVTVAPDGKMLSSRAFTKNCLDMPAPPADAFGFGVSHLLDPIPTEIHVSTALVARNPVLVMTGDRTWQFDGRSITLLDPSKIKGHRKR
jgi:hypothetical protein